MNYKLLIALLFVAPMVKAISYEDASQKISAAQARVDAAQRRLDQLNAEIKEGSDAASSIAGKHEYRDEITQKTNQVRARIKAHHDARKAHRKAERELQGAISEVGREHTVSQEGGKFVVTRPETRELEPIRMPRP